GAGAGGRAAANERRECAPREPRARRQSGAEFLQEACTAPALADALVPLLADTPERRRQVAAFARLDEVMGLPAAPSAKAADVVLSVIRAFSGKSPPRT